MRAEEGEGCAEEASHEPEDEGAMGRSSRSVVEECAGEREGEESLVLAVGKQAQTGGKQVSCSDGEGGAVGEVLRSRESESRERTHGEGYPTPEPAGVRKLVEERENEHLSVAQTNEEDVPCPLGEGSSVREGVQTRNTESRKETPVEEPPRPEATRDDGRIVDRDAVHSGIQEAAEHRRIEGASGKQTANTGTKSNEDEIFACGLGEGQRLSVPTGGVKLRGVVPVNAESELAQLPSFTPQCADVQICENRVRDASNGGSEQGPADDDKVWSVVPVGDEPERVRLVSWLPKESHRGMGEEAEMTAPGNSEGLSAGTFEKAGETAKEQPRAPGHGSQQNSSRVGAKGKHGGLNRAGEDIERMSDEARPVSPVDEAGKRLQLPSHAQHHVRRSVGESGVGAAWNVAGMVEKVRGTLPVADSGEQRQVPVLESGKADDDGVILAVPDKLLTVQRVVEDGRRPFQPRGRLPGAADGAFLKSQDAAAQLLPPSTTPVTKIVMDTEIQLQPRPEQEREGIPRCAGVSRRSERNIDDLQGTKPGNSGLLIIQIEDDGDVQLIAKDAHDNAADGRVAQKLKVQEDGKLPHDRSASDTGRLRTRNSTPVIIQIDDDAELERSSGEGHVTAIGNKTTRNLGPDGNEQLQCQQRTGDCAGEALEESTPVIIHIEDDEVLEQRRVDTGKMACVVSEAQEPHMASDRNLGDQRSTIDGTTGQTGNGSGEAIRINDGGKLAEGRAAEDTNDRSAENGSARIQSGMDCWKPNPSRSSDTDGGLNLVTHVSRDVQLAVPPSVATPQRPIILEEHLEGTITLQEPHIALERSAPPHPLSQPAAFANQVISKPRAESLVESVEQECKAKLIELGSEPLSKPNVGQSTSAVQCPRFRGPPLATAAAFRRWQSQNGASSLLEGTQPKLSPVCGKNTIGVQVEAMLLPRRNAEVQHGQVVPLPIREENRHSDTYRHGAGQYPQVGSSTQPLAGDTFTPLKGSAELPSLPGETLRDETWLPPSSLGTVVRKTGTPNKVPPCQAVGESVQPWSNEDDLRVCSPLGMALSSCTQGNTNTWFVPDGTVASPQHGHVSLQSEEMPTCPIERPTATGVPSRPQQVQCGAQIKIGLGRDPEGSQQIASIDMPMGIRMVPKPTGPPSRPPTLARSVLLPQGRFRREKFSEDECLELLRTWREAVEDPNVPFNRRAAIPSRLVSHVAAAVNVGRVRRGDPQLSEKQVSAKMWYFRRKFISSYGDVLMCGGTSFAAFQKFKYHTHMKEIIERTIARAETGRQAYLGKFWSSSQGSPASRDCRADTELPRQVTLRQPGVEHADEFHTRSVIDTPATESPRLDSEIHARTEGARRRLKRPRTDMDGELATSEGASVLDAGIARGGPLKRPRTVFKAKHGDSRYVPVQVVNSDTNVLERGQVQLVWARHLSSLGWRSRFWPGWRAAGTAERYRRMLPDWARANFVQR